MSHTYAHNLMHCVFSTKERMHLIRDPEALWRYTVGLAHEKGVHVIAAGGTTNHAHLLILLPQTLPLAKVMQEVKANTSRWTGRRRARFSGRRDTEHSALAVRNGILWHGTSRISRSITVNAVTKKSSSRCCENPESRMIPGLCLGKGCRPYRTIFNFSLTPTQHSGSASMLG